MDGETLEEMLIRHEGTRATPYLDTRGVWTVGVGHNMNTPLSHAAIMTIFRDDLRDAVSACVHAFPWFSDLTEPRQHVLVDMCFNLGLQGLLKFVNMLKAIEMDEYETAAKEMLESAWAHQVKGRATELAAMMRG